MRGAVFDQCERIVIEVAEQVYGRLAKVSSMNA